MNAMEGFWKGKPVLVTGANGFIGSHLTEKLVSLGADVHVFLRGSSSANYSNLAGVSGKIKRIYGNLIDITSVENALKQVKGLSDLTIFHLAAQAHVGESWQRPYETMHANLFGTLNILQAIVNLDLNIRKMTFAGTSEEYGNISPYYKDYYHYVSGKDGKRMMFTESTPLNPESPYAVSKVGADMLCRNYQKAYGIPTVITRMFNNFGPRENARYVTPTIITQALSRQTVELGALEPTRDYMYVKDGANAHLHAAWKGQPGGIYIFGYEDDISVGDWANMILKVGAENGFWPDNRKVVARKDRMRPGKSDIMKLGVDCSRTREELGWKKEFTREQAIKETIEWYKNNPQFWMSQKDWA